MGWFSKKKKIYVSSVTYNLAGDEKDHVKFLPTTILSKIISNTSFDMSDTIRTALLSGPGMRMRTFGRWARNTGYTAATGLQTGKLMGKAAIDVDALETAIAHETNEDVTIDNAEIGVADYSYWADQWMAENHPTEIDGEYTLDFKEDINTVFIVFTDGHSYSFQPVNFDATAQYMYVSYTLITFPGPLPAVWGPVEETDEFPPTDGWVIESDDSTPGSMDLTTIETTVVSYSDGRPDEVSTVVTPSTVSYTNRSTFFSLESFDGSGTGSEDEILSFKTLQRNITTAVKNEEVTTTTESETLPDDVVKTTEVTTSVESLSYQNTYQAGTQKIITKRWSVRKTLIYKYGSGQAGLDAMFGTVSDTGVYFPFIPIRQGERMFDEDYYKEMYELNLKAYPKAFGRSAKYTKLLDNLNSNESISDVDHGFIVFGVAVNTKDKSSLKYIYKFFQTILQQGGGEGGYDAWKAEWNLADFRVKAWVSWREAQSNPDSPLYGTPEPEKGKYPAAPTTKVNLISESFNYNITVLWTSLYEITGSGLGKADAKTGDVWWTIGTSEEFNETVYSGGVAGFSPSVQDSVTLTWQDSPTTYRTLYFTGLHHTNIVYKGKGVDYDIIPALQETDVTGFVIPLHEGVFRSMSLVDQTQMSQGNSYLVLNSYEVVKQKWYQTSLFKIIVVIIIIVVSIFFPPAGGVGAGILGTAAAVGASLGFVGVMAIIVGTIANALAAMILSQIIMMGATSLFGDKIGTIIGTIASVIALSIGTSMANGGTYTQGLENLSSAENILKFTEAAGKGMAAFINDDTANIMKQTQEVMDDYQRNLDDINSKWYENLGYGEILFDPMQLTDIANTGYYPESSNMFLGRTLLTGSEIAAMTNTLITDFTSVSISTELPT